MARVIVLSLLLSVSVLLMWEGEEAPKARADSPVFLRGDCDGDADVFAILDAVYLLEYGFNDGPVPPCLDAADVDGNGVVFPILDALYLLEYGFTNGPAPPDPGPDDCGVGTGEGPGCDTPPSC